MMSFSHWLHLQFTVDTAEETLEEGVKSVIILLRLVTNEFWRQVLSQMSPYMPFLRDSQESFQVSVKRLTVATSNKSFKCIYQREPKGKDQDD